MSALHRRKVRKTKHTRLILDFLFYKIGCLMQMRMYHFIYESNSYCVFYSVLDLHNCYECVVTCFKKTIVFIPLKMNLKILFVICLFHKNSGKYKSIFIYIFIAMHVARSLFVSSKKCCL